MDVNSARIIIGQMQGRFKKLNVPFINESEINGCDGFSNAIRFRSWLNKNDNLAEILAFVFPSHNIVQLTMNYYLNIEDFDESTMYGFFTLLNAANSSNSAFYWIFLHSTDKIEFRTAYYLSGSRLSERQFESLFERFIKQGPLYYSYFKRLIDHNEDPNKLFLEMQFELKAL